ncbi:unnamed protein product [Rhizophagus irregularis]|nr:unnamed protein product [Rhizophagus irregularis]
MGTHLRCSRLLEKYPSMKDYLTRTFYPSRRAWACAFTSRIFTAGVQTTSYVKGYNNIIKHELKSNGTLCNLASVIDARLESEDLDVNITDRCIEDQYDAKKTLLKSMMAEVGEERIQELWKITDV